jgi:hypothetical protein
VGGLAHLHQFRTLLLLSEFSCGPPYARVNGEVANLARMLEQATNRGGQEMVVVVVLSCSQATVSKYKRFILLTPAKFRPTASLVIVMTKTK